MNPSPQVPSSPCHSGIGGTEANGYSLLLRGFLKTRNKQNHGTKLLRNLHHTDAEHPNPEAEQEDVQLQWFSVFGSLNKYLKRKYKAETDKYYETIINDSEKIGLKAKINPGGSKSFFYSDYPKGKDAAGKRRYHVPYHLGHFPEMKIEIVPNFYDKSLDLIDYNKTDDSFNVLYLSNIIKSKGIFELIDAFIIFSKENIAT